MKFIPTHISGVYILELEKLSDERGYFARAWCTQEFAKHGLNATCVQINTNYSLRAGTVRGLHYQVAPRGEVKIVRCTRGGLFDVAVDVRPGSPTRGQWVGVELTPENGRSLYIPEGCAHGMQTLVDDTEIFYQATEFFAPDCAHGYRHDDPALAIDWPLPVSVVSQKDQQYPDWTQNAPELVSATK